MRAHEGDMMRLRGAVPRARGNRGVAVPMARSRELGCLALSVAAGGALAHSTCSC